MSTIFISYRRDDSLDICGRITDRISARYGPKQIFKDVDSIAGGALFPQQLAIALQQCEVALVVIGAAWLHITDPYGRRRLDDPRDFVRYEIEQLLQKNIPIIPVLVHGALMPILTTLPASLNALAYFQALSIRPDPDFDQDLTRLTSTIKQQLAAAPPVLLPKQQGVFGRYPWYTILAFAPAVCFLIYVALHSLLPVLNNVLIILILLALLAQWSASIVVESIIGRVWLILLNVVQTPLLFTLAFLFDIFPGPWHNSAITIIPFLLMLAIPCLYALSIRQKVPVRKYRMVIQPVRPF